MSVLPDLLVVSPGAGPDAWVGEAGGPDGKRAFGGLLMALPVVTALLITNIALGVLTRAAPQLNLFAIGFPITLTVGFGVLLLALGHLAPLLQYFYDAGFTTLAVPAALAGEMSWTTPGSYTWTVPDGVTSASALVVDGSGGDVGFGALTITAGPTTSHADATLTSSNGFSLTAPTSAGSYGVSSGVAAYDNDMPLTPGAQITVNVPGPDGAVRVIWGTGRSFPNNAASAGTQIGIVLVAKGGGAGQWQRVDGNFNPVNYPFGGAFFNSHPTYAGVVAQTIDGQAMMKVPKYYLKTGTVPSGTYAGKRYWMVSDQPVSGFSVHPAFMNAGAQIDQFWVGKYQGTNDGGTKLGSVAGNTPLVSIDFPTMQTRANNRNTGGVTGFGLWNIYQLSAIQTLALIEMGGSDSQTLVGQGHVSGSSALAVDNATVAQATWRGIVGLWGNVWQMVDGLQTDASSKYKIWDKNGNKTYQTTSLTTTTGINYPVTMATATGTDYDLATVFAAETTNASAASATFPDVFYSGASCVAVHPRWRGEQSAISRECTVCDGSSPLARGTVSAFSPSENSRRFIPAGAGNSSHWSACRHATTVHPRWRGEQSSR